MKKNKHPCPWCIKSFDTPRGVSIHRTRADHWTNPNPPPVIESNLVSYASLVRGVKGWGEKMTESEKKGPTKENLKLGALFRIIELLESIDQELKRPKRLF